jgi:hypothetical protein
MSNEQRRIDRNRLRDQLKLRAAERSSIPASDYGAIRDAGRNDVRLAAELKGIGGDPANLDDRS